MRDSFYVVLMLIGYNPKSGKHLSDKFRLSCRPALLHKSIA